MICLTVSVFFKMIDHHSWQMYSDIQCKHCGKNQFYGTYISNNNSCVICNQTQEIPILVIDDFPIVFESNEIIEQLNAKIESILVLNSLLEYEDVKYTCNYKSTKPYITVQFKSTIKNKMIQFTIYSNSHGKYCSTSLNTRISSIEKTSKNLDIFDVLNEIERIL